MIRSKSLSLFPSVFAASLLLAPALLRADVFDAWGHRFVDGEGTGGLYHFDEVYYDAASVPFTPDDTSVTGRPAHPLELRNDATATTISGNGYYDAAAHSWGDSFLNTRARYVDFFEDPARRVVIETIITTADPNWTEKNQDIVAVNGAFSLRLVRAVPGPVPDLIIWEKGADPVSFRPAENHPLRNLENGRDYYLRAIYDRDQQKIELTINEHTLSFDWVEMADPNPLNALYVGIRGGDRFRGQIHEVKVSQQEIGPPTTGFDSWRAEHFTPEELEDPSISGAAADPAGDGVENLVKYAFGLAPKEPARDRMPAPELIGEHLAVTYPQDLGATDVTIVVEVSPDLVNWASGPEQTEEISRLEGDGVDLVTVRDLTPVTEAERRFLRVRVEQN